MASNTFQDLTGKVFGRLTVLEFRREGKIKKWLCVCECGNKKIIWGSSLKGGTTQSCGCLQKERTSKAKRTHGHTAAHLYNCETREYKAWCLMKYRCNNPHYHEYATYGGRGVKVCERWQNSFENFYADMGDKPTPKHTLDRFPDQNGDYGPTNCRWATQLVQQGNRTNNVWHEKNGRRMILSDWARYMNLNPKNMTGYIKSHKGFDNMYNYFLNKGTFTETTIF